MSKTQQTAADEVEINKTVQVVCYAPEGYADYRQWASKFDDWYDYTATNVEEEKDVTVSFNGEEMMIRRFDTKKLIGADTGDIDLEVEEKVVERHEVEERRFARFARNQLIEEEPDELCGYELWQFSAPKWKDADGDVKAGVYTSKGSMPVLKPADERTAEDEYVDENRAVPYVAMKVRMNGLSEEEVEEVDVRLTEPLITAAEQADFTGPVRIDGCEKETVETGTCTNL